jgi:hypothetical protein
MPRETPAFQIVVINFLISMGPTGLGEFFLLHLSRDCATRERALRSFIGGSVVILITLWVVHLSAPSETIWKNYDWRCRQVAARSITTCRTVVRLFSAVSLRSKNSGRLPLMQNLTCSSSPSQFFPALASRRCSSLGCIIVPLCGTREACHALSQPF